MSETALPSVDRRQHLPATWAAWALLALLLAAQAAFSASRPRDWAWSASPGAPPTQTWLQVASLGEDAAAAYAMTLYLQTFDAQAGLPMPLRSLDQAAVRAWLDRALDLNPRSAYPLLLAARVYAQGGRPDDARPFLEWVHERFLQAPDQRWPWLAHALFIARHTLKDMPLALRYARSLREHATGPGVPAWVGQAELLLLADVDEAHAAQVLLGGLIASGRLTDENERRFLMERLQDHGRDAQSDDRSEPKEGIADKHP